jgi:hypothetical protein
MSDRPKTVVFPLALTLVLFTAGFMMHHLNRVQAAGPVEAPHPSYRILAAIESGNLLLFPVVQSSKMLPASFALARLRMAFSVPIRSLPPIAETRSTRWSLSITLTSRCFCSPAKSSLEANRIASSPETASFPREAIPST